MTSFLADLGLSESLAELLTGLGLNVVVLFTIIRGGYIRARRQRSYIGTLVFVNLLVFVATYLMRSVTIDVGVGFGLFALFAVLRFRTTTLPIAEMTYLFAAFAVAAVHALGVGVVPTSQLIVLDVALMVPALLSPIWLLRENVWVRVEYEKIEFLRPERRSDLVADLKSRLGIDVLGVDINSVDLISGTARLRVEIARDNSQFAGDPPDDGELNVSTY